MKRGDDAFHVGPVFTCLADALTVAMAFPRMIATFIISSPILYHVFVPVGEQYYTGSPVACTAIRKRLFVVVILVAGWLKPPVEIGEPAPGTFLCHPVYPNEPLPPTSWGECLTNEVV